MVLCSAISFSYLYYLSRATGFSDANRNLQVSSNPCENILWIVMKT